MEDLFALGVVGGFCMIGDGPWIFSVGFWGSEWAWLVVVFCYLLGCCFLGFGVH